MTQPCVLMTAANDTKNATTAPTMRLHMTCKMAATKIGALTMCPKGQGGKLKIELTIIFVSISVTSNVTITQHLDIFTLYLTSNVTPLKYNKKDWLK